VDTVAVLAWLIQGGVGPALVALPVNWAADECARLAKRWFRRLRRTDSLSRLIKAATGASADLTDAEFDAVRQLLEDQQTWIVVGRGTAEDLATLIASCLRPRDGLTVDESREAARTIARGLLEFVVADLDPPLFQQVLLARLQRLESAQASALDESLLGLYADLAAILAERGEVERRLFLRVMRQLDLVLDRLPSGFAGHAEIGIYLTTLIRWMNADPWPRDRRFGGPILTPGAIERKLWVSETRQSSKQYLEADKLAKTCRRLVVLGGPGTGKTWLAKRSVRQCAEAALDALATGSSLDEIELPLFTTCSQLFHAEGNIRQAVVSTALDQLGDLGGSRLNAALCQFFTERNAPTLLVLDSLDEASGPEARLRQVDTLPWRIILTSRPISWNNQLSINDLDISDRVGTLQPLRYPDDVDPFIRRWFDKKPSWGREIAEQIARRPSLQKAATVPLITAFYCIVGGDKPLPDFRHDLYARVLRRMLTGRWRDRGDREINDEACLQVLEGWAWAGASSDPLSGVGTWADDIPSARSQGVQAEKEALDHVAGPLGPPDVDTGVIVRRFIHRSIREYLVARHVAALSAEQAVKELLSHIWYDPDWEYAAPAALAMHPKRDEVLQQLMRSAVRSDQTAADIFAIDGCWEFRRFLAQVAAETSPADWTPSSAEIIRRARSDLAITGQVEKLEVSAHWKSSNCEVQAALVDLIAAGEMDGRDDLAQAVVRLAATNEERGQAKMALLDALISYNLFMDDCRQLADAVTQLGPTADDQRQARQVLVKNLSAQRLVDNISLQIDTIIRLEPTAGDLRKLRVGLLEQIGDAWPNWEWVVDAAEALVRLKWTREDRQRFRMALLARLAMADAGDAEELATMVARFVVSENERTHAREELLRLLNGEAVDRAAAGLADAVAQLSVTAEERSQARQVLLQLLDGGTDSVAGLADTTTRLAMTTAERVQTRGALLSLLNEETVTESSAWLAMAVAALDPTAEQRHQTRGAMLTLLARETSSWEARLLAEAVMQLGPTTQDRRQIRDRLLKLLAWENHGLKAASLGEMISRLEPTVEDRCLAREALLRLFIIDDSRYHVSTLAETLIRLSLTAEERTHVQKALLGRLARETRGHTASPLAEMIAGLDPTVEIRRQAREALLRVLGRETHASEVLLVTQPLARLEPTAEDQRRVRDALLSLLARTTSSGDARDLEDRLAQFRPTLHDLSKWRTWACPPTADLLAAVRQNSTLVAWLASLPSLSTGTPLSSAP